MSGPTERKGQPIPSETAAPATLTVPLRRAREEDVAALVPLLLRLKRRNEEFDPLLRVRDDAEQQARQILKADLARPKAVVLVVEGVGADRGQVVGFARAHVRERAFYAPKLEGVILDIYLIPTYRRRGVGEQVLAELTRILKAKGAGLVTAELPAQDEIATRFCSKRGFRPLTAVEARPL